MVSTNIITVNLSLETEIEKAQRLGSLNPLEEARPFPTRGFKTIETNQLVEEEELPDHRADRFCPARPGEIFQKRYQIVAKRFWYFIDNLASSGPEVNTCGF